MAVVDRTYCEYHLEQNRRMRLRGLVLPLARGRGAAPAPLLARDRGATPAPPLALGAASAPALALASAPPAPAELWSAEELEVADFMVEQLWGYWLP